MLIAVLVGRELRPLFAAGARDAGGVSCSVACVFAILLCWGLPLAILAAALGTTVEERLRRADVAMHAAKGHKAGVVGYRRADDGDPRP